MPTDPYIELRLSRQDDEIRDLREQVRELRRELTRRRTDWSEEAWTYLPIIVAVFLPVLVVVAKTSS